MAERQRRQAFPDFDVIVAGGGMAGLCAAVAASEKGARVLVIEKAPHCGGSMLISNGNFALFAERAHALSLGRGGNARLQEMVLDQSRSRIAWLRMLGVPIDHLGLAFDSYDLYRTDPPVLLEVLLGKLRESNIKIRLGARLADIDTSDTHAGVGLVVEQDDGKQSRMSASAVVLATGGFQGDPTLVTRYLGESATHAYHRANVFSSGEGLSAALTQGASLSPGMNTFYGHAMPANLTIAPKKWAALTQYYGSWSVALNLNGQRFVDESAGVFEENVNFALAQQPAAMGFYVLDHNLATRTIDSKIPTAAAILNGAREAGGVVITAGSIEELSNQMAEHGVQARAASTALTTFDQAILTGDDTLLQVPRNDHRIRLHTPPFTAVKVKASITMTTGGLAVDQRMRVLRTPAAGEDVVSGLYAAGADVGAISHHGYFGGLPTALVTGFTAGSAAAAFAGRPPSKSFPKDKE